MTAANPDEPVLDALIRVDHIPAAGRDLTVVASEAQRLALAEVMRVTTVDRFQADLHVVTLRGGIRVTGRLVARIVQPCVVTLQPVVQEIDEPIDRVFLSGAEAPYAGPSGAEVFVDLEGDDMPDHLLGPEADLAPLLTETLALAIDPYPRATGASLEALGEVDDGALSPFAGLKSLKNLDEDG